MCSGNQIGGPRGAALTARLQGDQQGAPEGAGQADKGLAHVPEEAGQGVFCALLCLKATSARITLHTLN